MPGRKWWPLAVVVTGIFMLLVDITIVNVALPDIARSLGASFTDLQWVIDAYSLALATFVLNAGALADRFGRRKLFAGGLVFFTAASIACGLSTSPLFLIVARGIQGIGGAAVFATFRKVGIATGVAALRGDLPGARPRAAGGLREEREIASAYANGYGRRLRESWVGELGLTLLGKTVDAEERCENPL